MEKQVFDSRGRQASIGRLLPFDKEAFIHMLFYRILIVLSLVAGTAFVLYYFALVPSVVFEALFVLVWVFFTPQVYETAKGISVMLTGGFVHGYLNKSYLRTVGWDAKHPLAPIYRVMPYAVLGIWIAGLVLLSYVWLV